MKRDKAFLQLEGKLLLDIQMEKLQAIGSKKTSVVVAEKSEQFKNYQVVTDIYENRGTLGGIHTALKNCDEKYALILACDLPFVSARFLLFLIEKMEGKSFDCIAPIQTDGIIQPLCGIYNSERGEKILTAMLEESAETPPARDFVKRIDTKFIEFAEFADLPGAENFFFNLNTPENFQTAQKIASQ